MKKTVIVGVLGIATLLVGCGKRTQFNSQPTPEASQVSVQQVEPAKVELPDLSQVSVSSTNLRITNASVLAFDLIQNQLVLRTEQYTNPNSESIWIWIDPQSSGLHFWGLCSLGRGQYQANPSPPKIELQGAILISRDLPTGGWGVFELAAGASATVEWVTGGSWSWIPGPWQSPGQSCDETRPQRGWAGLEIAGSIREDVRVSLPGVSYGEATGDRNFLDSKRVLALPEVEQSLYEHWGDGS